MKTRRARRRSKSRSKVRRPRSKKMTGGNYNAASYYVVGEFVIAVPSLPNAFQRIVQETNNVQLFNNVYNRLLSNERYLDLLGYRGGAIDRPQLPIEWYPDSEYPKQKLYFITQLSMEEQYHNFADIRFQSIGAKILDETITDLVQDSFNFRGLGVTNMFSLTPDKFFQELNRAPNVTEMYRNLRLENRV